MGIGIALATGLVQGFHQNIQEEKARRQGEQEKLDKYKELVMNASLTSKNFSQTNADMINQMIASAQGKIDSRERINIFGQQGERVDVDFTDLVSKLTSTTEDDVFTTDFFGMTIPVPEKYSDQEGTNRGDSMLYGALNNYRLKNPGAFEEHFASNPTMFGAARQEIVNLGKGTLRFAAQNSTGDTNFTVNTSELPGYEDFFNPFFKISKTQQYNAQWDAVRESMRDNESSIVDSPNLIPLAGSLFTDAVNENGEPVKTKPTDMIPFVWEELDGMDEIRWNSVGQIASLQGKDTSQFIYDFSSGFKDLQSFSDALVVATDLAALGAAKGNKRTGEDILMQGEYIYESPLLKDDVFAQANVFMAFQPLAMNQSEQDMIDAGITPQVTVGKGEAFKAQFENLVGLTYAKFQTKMSGVTGAQSKLKRYRDLVDQLPVTKASVLEDVVRIVTSIFGETGKIDQIVDIMGLSEDEYEGSGIAEFIEKDQRRLAKQRGTAYDAAQLISASDALAYIIAADLARAEDDQGRLSDADIERNLNKLRGFGATTKDGQLAAIDEVMRTIDSQSRSLAAIDRVAENGMATGVISRDDRRLLAADKQARKARQMYLDSIAGMQPEEEAQAAVSVDMLANETPTMTVDGVAYYQLGDQYVTLSGQGEESVATIITEDDFAAAYTRHMTAPTPAVTPSPVTSVAPDSQLQGQGGGQGGTPLSGTDTSTAANTVAQVQQNLTAAAAAAAPDNMTLSAQEAGATPSQTVGGNAAPVTAADAGKGPVPPGLAASVQTIPDDVIPLRKFAQYKIMQLTSNPDIVGFYGLKPQNTDGTPRMFRKVFDANNKLIGYREMRS